MKKISEELEASRVRDPLFDAAFFNEGVYGKFKLRSPFFDDVRITVISSGAEPIKSSLGWEHVSVSVNAPRCPTWEEMCFVKDLFWGEEETVIQFHPPRSEYVNNHKYVLHLWKNIDNHVRTPPSVLVGDNRLGDVTNRPDKAREIMRRMAGR